MKTQTKRLRPFRADDAQWEAVRQAAEREGMTMADWIRRALAAALERA